MRGLGLRARPIGLALALLAGAPACAKRAGASSTAGAELPVGVEAPATVKAPAAATGPGYTLLDRPAIQRAVHDRGRPVLVHFWASWCGPCLEELPVVDAFARDARGRGVDVLSLSLDDPQRAGTRVVEVLTRSAPSLTRHIVQVADSDAFINAIDPKWEGSIPAIFAFDAAGMLKGRLVGEASRRDLDGLAAKISEKSAEKR